uniref:C-type lectin domain-containing protein n=1 Tax=Lates calcarifer TaxID=8187 RepID=A0A4W6EYU4_LATCA
MKQLNVNLTSERDQLQTNYSEMKQLNTENRETSKMLNYSFNKLRVVFLLDALCFVSCLVMRLPTSFCPADWIRFNISCYLISTSKKSWDDSKQFCENEKAHLVIVSEEQVKKENVWKWVDGTEVTTTYWRNSQPDNGGRKGPKDEDCVQIQNTWRDLKNWNDLRCNNELHFICEKILK